jgi:hypothetical protein
MVLYFVPQNARIYRSKLLIPGDSNCKCFKDIKKPSTYSSNTDVIQSYTQTSRVINAIRYSRGGRLNYGYFGETLPKNTIFNGSGIINPENGNIITVKPISFLGRTEGQPGGLIGTIKNKF